MDGLDLEQFVFGLSQKRPSQMDSHIVIAGKRYDLFTKSKIYENYSIMLTDSGSQVAAASFSPYFASETGIAAVANSGLKVFSIDRIKILPRYRDEQATFNSIGGFLLDLLCTQAARINGVLIDEPITNEQSYKPLLELYLTHNFQAANGQVYWISPQ